MRKCAKFICFNRLIVKEEGKYGLPEKIYVLRPRKLFEIIFHKICIRGISVIKADNF